MQGTQRQTSQHLWQLPGNDPTNDKKSRGRCRDLVPVSVWQVPTRKVGTQIVGCSVIRETWFNAIKPFIRDYRRVFVRSD